jgi:hypothetical protein
VAAAAVGYFLLQGLTAPLDVFLDLQGVGFLIVIMLNLGQFGEIELKEVFIAEAVEAEQPGDSS